MPAAKKLVNIFFSLVLIAGLLPVTAFASPDQGPEENANGKAVVVDQGDAGESASGSETVPSNSNEAGESNSPELDSAKLGNDSDSDGSQDVQGATSSQEDSDLENSWRYTNGVLTVQDDSNGVDMYSNDSSRAGKTAMRSGIDVSEHNGTIDWDKAKADGVDFAILRIGFIHDNGRGRSDYQWERNVSECERLGIPYGVYVYSYAETASHASTEADFVLQRLKGHNPSYPVYYDLEDNCQLSVAQNHGMGALAQTFCNKIAAAGYTPGVYANTNWWTNYLTDSCFGNWEKWVAQYNSSCTYKGNYSIWQYTSSGYVDGIDGRVDMNFDYEGSRKIGQFNIEDRFAELSTSNSADIQDGEYLIQSKLSDKSVIRVAGSGSQENSALALYGSVMWTDQKFALTKDRATGCYRIRSIVSGKYLCLLKSGSYYSPNIVLADKDAADNSQLWVVEKRSDGSLCFKAAINDGFCLDVANSSTEEGSSVALYKEKGLKNQAWSLVATSPKVEGGRTVADGVYSLSSKSDPSKVLEVEGGSSANGANVRSWSSYGAAYQRFRVQMGADGFYTLTNVQSGKALDAEGGNLVQGTNAQQWEPNGGDAQKWAIKPDGSGSYVLVCKANGLALDLSGGTAKDGTNANCWTQNGGKGQSFSFDAPAAGAVADGTYIVSCDLDPFKVFDIPNGSASDGAPVSIWESNMSAWQRFDFDYDDETGYYSIRNVNSGKYLDALGGSASNGTQVGQYPGNGRLNQRWIVEATGSSFVIRSAADPRFVMDLTGASSANGTKVELYSYSGNANQRFSLVAAFASPVSESDNFGFDGWYEVSPSSDGSLRMDIANSSKNDGAQALLYSNTSRLNQLFRFEYVNGYYEIVSASSGKVLEFKNGSVVPGVPAQQASSSESLSQKWKAVENEDGTYSFICAANGLMLGSQSSNSGASLIGLNGPSDGCSSFRLGARSDLLNEGIYEIAFNKDSNKVLDVNGASSSDGANVQIYASNSTFNQKWRVKLVSGMKNTYTVESLCSGKFLASVGSNVVQSAYDQSSQNQMWMPVQIDAGSVVLKNIGTGKVLDVDGGNAADGTNVQIYDENGSSAQKFIFREAKTVKSATYIFHSDANYNQVMDLNGSSGQDGANVTSWALSGAGNQKWNVNDNGDGTYRISSAVTGKVLDVSGGVASDGANVAQYSWHGGLNQKWIIEYDKDGGFVFRSAQNRGMVLEVSSFSPANGTNICVAKRTGEANQRFSLEKTIYTPPVPSDRQEMKNRINGYSSGTGWLIAVDRSTHKVGVFSGYAGNWSMQYYWSCVTGAPSTPTITGSYRTTGFKRTSLSTDARAKWCTQIWGGYFFHTILNSDAELGNSLSHGCLRMSYPSAQWIYNNIYAGTAVVIYN